MKKVMYDEGEIELIRLLVNSPPEAIWNHFSAYIFSYTTFHITITMAETAAATQNSFDEIIYCKIERCVGSYEASKEDNLVCEKKVIQAAYIMRTLLFFGTYQPFSKKKRRRRTWIYQLKRFFGGKNDPFNKLWSELDGMSTEFNCNPKNEQANLAMKEFSNLVDAGVLLQIDGKYLQVYADQNFYGFNVRNNHYFTDFSELGDIYTLYELIKIE